MPLRPKLPPKAVSSAAPDPRTTPTGVKAPHGAKVFEMSFADGQTLRISHRLLRGYCPCAGCQGHGGGISFVEAGNPDLRELGQVGNYALELTWGDAHSTGIYTFRYLRHLLELARAHGEALPEHHPELPPP